MKSLLTIFILILSSNIYALTKSSDYRVGTLVEVSNTFYEIKTTQGKFIKVKPFLKNPIVGLEIRYPVYQNVKFNKRKWVDVTPELLKNKKTVGKVLAKYIDTMAAAQSAGKMKVEPLQKNAYSVIWNMFIKPAYSGEGSCTDNTCFFGGWPSKVVGRYCQAPWKHKKNDELQAMNLLAYDKSARCGSSSLFRCNPTVFGTIPDNIKELSGVNLKASSAGNRGMCIEIKPRGYKDLTKQCVTAAKKIPGYEKRLKTAYAATKENMDKIVKSVQCFCSNSKYSRHTYCKDLEKFLLDINQKEEARPEKPEGGKRKPDSKVSEFGNCEFVGDAVYGERTKSDETHCYQGSVCVSKVKCIEGEKSTTVYAYCSCGASDVYECIKQPRAGGETAVPTGQSTPAIKQ